MRPYINEFVIRVPLIQTVFSLWFDSEGCLSECQDGKSQHFIYPLIIVSHVECRVEIYEILEYLY